MIDSNKTRFDNVFVKYFIFIITKSTYYTPFLMQLEKYNVRYIVCGHKANILHCIWSLSQYFIFYVVSIHCVWSLNQYLLIFRVYRTGSGICCNTDISSPQWATIESTRPCGNRV
jgi:hypothetical protein